jgi:hypothetical protein
MAAIEGPQVVVVCGGCGREGLKGPDKTGKGGQLAVDTLLPGGLLLGR